MTCSTSVTLPHSSVSVVIFFSVNSLGHVPGNVTKEGWLTKLTAPPHSSLATIGGNTTLSMHPKNKVSNPLDTTGTRLSTTWMVWVMALWNPMQSVMSQLRWTM